MISALTLLPAIDVADGAAVRLLRGSLDDKTTYGSPLDVAREFIEVFRGATAPSPWVHLVDLDAAFGRGDNRDIIRDVTALLKEHGVNVEVSGGIRSSESLQHAVDMGAARVNVGTAALENPDWTRGAIAEFGDKLAIGLDVRGETLAARGWVKQGGNIWETMERLLADGANRFVITDVNQDGTLQGPNLKLLRDASTFILQNNSQTETPSSTHITASGGISSLRDLASIATLQRETDNIVDSVIFGKAMYSGRFTLAEALTETLSVM